MNLDLQEAPASHKPLKYGSDDVRQESHAAYRSWHRTLGDGCFAWDTDLIEGRRRRDPATGRYSGRIKPVAITETTSVERASQVESDAYIRRVLERLRGQGGTNDHGQIGFLSLLAERAGIPLFLIVYDRALTRFAVYEPRTGRILRQSREEHATWIKSLGREANE